jgi:secernin
MCDTFTTIGIAGALFAKNSDRPRDEPQVLRWHPPRRARRTLDTQYLTIPDHDAHGVLLSQPTWLWGAEHGINDKGVAIGNERLWAARKLDDAPALIGMDLVRLGLERAATADEACAVITELVSRHGQGGSCDAASNDPYDSSFLIADAHGGWVIETFGAEWVAAPLDGHGAISNRYGLGDAWTRSSPGVPAGFSTHDWHDARVDTRLADHRLRATNACAAGNRALDPTIAISTLRDHGTGPWGRPGHETTVEPPPAELRSDLSGVTVCMHGRLISTTTASMVARLHADGAPPDVWACIGSPCVGEYVQAALDALPHTLTDESNWWATAAIRDRVEAEPNTLPAVRAEIAPREAATFR